MNTFEPAGYLAVRQYVCLLQFFDVGTLYVHVLVRVLKHVAVCVCVLVHGKIILRTQCQRTHMLLLQQII